MFFAYLIYFREISKKFLELNLFLICLRMRKVILNEIAHTHVRLLSFLSKIMSCVLGMLIFQIIFCTSWNTVTGLGHTMVDEGQKDY